MSYSVSGFGTLPCTFVSTNIAVNVLNGRGTTETFLKSTRTAPAERLNDDCGVCLVSLSEDLAVSNKNCTHVYHRECIEALLSHDNKCPMCRAEWCCSYEDLRTAQTIQKLILSYQVDKTYDMSHWIPIYSEEELQQLIHNAVCMLAFCIQMQNLKLVEWKNQLAIPLPNDKYQAAAREQAARVQGASESRAGHKAIESLLRCIKQVTLKDLIGLAQASKGLDFDLAPLSKRLLRETFDDLKATSPKSKPSADLKLFIANVVYFTLRNVLTSLFDTMDELQDIQWEIDGVENTDIFDNVEDDEHVLALLHG